MADVRIEKPTRALGFARIDVVMEERGSRLARAGFMHISSGGKNKSWGSGEAWAVVGKARTFCIEAAGQRTEHNGIDPMVGQEGREARGDHGFSRVRGSRYSSPSRPVLSLHRGSINCTR